MTKSKQKSSPKLACCSFVPTKEPKTLHQRSSCFQKLLRSLKEPDFVTSFLAFPLSPTRGVPFAHCFLMHCGAMVKILMISHCEKGDEIFFVIANESASWRRNAAI